MLSGGGDGVVRASTGAVCVAVAAAAFVTFASGTVGWDESTGAVADGGVSLLWLSTLLLLLLLVVLAELLELLLLLLLLLLLDDEKEENPGMLMTDRRLLRTLRLRAMPRRDGGVSEFAVDVAGGLLALFESLAAEEEVAAWLEVENPVMPITEKRLVRGKRVLRLRVGADPEFPAGVVVG